MKTSALVLGGLLGLGPMSSCGDEVKRTLFGENPIEPPVPVVADTRPAPSAPPPEDPDPRLLYRLPDGSQASLEYAEAKQMIEQGRLSTARLRLYAKVMSPSGTVDEANLLVELCTRQDDAECVAEARARAKGQGMVDETQVFAKLREMAEKKPRDVEKQLLPRLAQGSLAPEELEILALACKKTRNKECSKNVQAILDMSNESAEP